MIVPSSVTFRVTSPSGAICAVPASTGFDLVSSTIPATSAMEATATVIVVIIFFMLFLLPKSCQFDTDIIKQKENDFNRKGRCLLQL